MYKVVFNEIIPDSYPVLKYVYPIMQKYVKQLIDQAYTVPSIDAIILFGSSVELSCGQDSDLDIVMLFEDELEEEVKEKAIKACRQGIQVPMDILTSSWRQLREESQHSMIYKEVVEKGLVIYRRDKV